MSRLARAVCFASLALATVAATGCGGTGNEATEDDAVNGSAAINVSRPPQFVILAFDGSYSLPFWRESRAFAQANNNLKFTYFISGVYFIPNNKKSGYIAPHGLGAGKSAIGWGGTEAEIQERYQELKLAAAEGHEIGSHANGHFDGSRWTEEDWNSEFAQFDKIIFQGVGTTAPDLGFGPRDSVGFRAPQLGHSPGLFRVLPVFKYTYDTSKSDAPNYWPKKIENAYWNMPLARLRIVGSGKATLSMDYNFYVADSRGEPNAANKELYKKQMIDTYMQYFEGNYFGNRAPLHIGHHFSKWNGGAYWEAMQTFARRVCGLPEVKCVTYKELVSFLEEKKDEIPDYQAGNFTKLPRPPGSEAPAALDVPGEDEIVPDSEHAHDERGE